VWIPVAVLGAYLVIRAIVELLVIDYGDPATYRNDWGGPSLVGVLAVHCLPGILVLIAVTVWLWRRRSGRDEPHTLGGP
jgi:hypothetical protein